MSEPQEANLLRVAVDQARKEDLIDLDVLQAEERPPTSEGLMDLLDFARDAWYGCIDWRIAEPMIFLFGLFGVLRTIKIWTEG